MDTEEVDLAGLTAQSFTPLAGETFTAVYDDGAIPFELEEVRAGAVAPAAGMRVPFSLFFLGPEDLVYPQGIYPLEHPRFGWAGIFLVPVGEQGRRIRYQAVFS